MTIYDITFEVVARFDAQVEADSEHEAAEKLRQGEIVSNESLSEGYIESFEEAVVEYIEEA